MWKVNGWLCAVVALAGCPPMGTGGPARTGPGNLTMRADWPNACTTCSKVTFPNHCWSGTWTSGTTTSGGTTSFAARCQQRDEINGNPNPISVATSVVTLKPGRWTVQLSVEGVATASCTGTVPEAASGFVWVDPSGCHAIP